MSAMTIFTWGYYGWGNATPQLVEIVDTMEQTRGFDPPLFVDIRIRRTVRAKGFLGNAFEKLLGPDRHRWMKSLGNKFIETRKGPSIQIADPAAAQELLDLAVKLADGSQVSVRYGDVLRGRVRWALSYPRGSPTDVPSQPSCQEARAVLA